MPRHRSTTSIAAADSNNNQLGIPLSIWIQRAKEYSLSQQQQQQQHHHQGGGVDYYYVELAVTVALELTNHLCEVVDEIRSKEATDASPAAAVPPSSPLLLDERINDNGDYDLCATKEEEEEPKISEHYDFSLSDEAAILPLLKVEHITPENVIVSIGVAGTTTTESSNDDDAPGAKNNFLVATGAHIQVGLSHLTDDYEIDDNHHRPLTQRDVCYALGKILLDIFAQGDTFDYQLLLMDLGFDINDDEVKGSPLDDISSHSISLSESSSSSPSRKLSRRTANDTKSATLEFMKAKAFLEERGLPRSICELVSDLLRAKEEEEDKQAILSVEDAQFDLLQMKMHPSRFLHDNTCSTMALDFTSLFSRSNNEKLYGRDKEMNLLMESAARLYLHTSSQSGGGISSSVGGGPHQQQRTHNFMCDVVLLSGYSGCGKTSIVKKFASFINANDWLVLTCEFDRQVAPISLLLQSVDLFLARFVIHGSVKRVPKIQLQFDRIFNYATLTVDRESHAELCELMPSFRSLFPTSSFDFACERNTRNNPIVDHASSTIRAVGSGSNRLKYLFRLIFNAICNGGYPVSYVFDDLQWSDSTTMDIIKDIIQPSVDGSLFSSSEDSAKRGLLLLGSFRKNELDEGTLVDRLKPIGADNHISLRSIYVDELSEQEINKMLSYKFCLSLRQTRLLAQTVYQKTRGHPLYTTEFLRSIINDGMMAFSIKDRRWLWDETLIDLQMISEGVVELLTRKLQQLHRDIITALKVVSCIGMIDVTTIKLLDCGQFVPDMFDSLDSAVQEGIVDRAGPIFAFTHDLLQESTLNLMRECERNLLRKQIGKSLVVHPMIADNAAICCLAVKQINMCKDVDSMLDDSERALFARLNLAAGKHSFAASSYEQARDYFEAGISLLHSDPWNQQYSLCLELFEMSAVVDLMDGNVETVSMKLDCILSNSNSFDDSLNARALRAKFLASQGQFGEAIKEIVFVLSTLGEDFPGDINSSYLLNEIRVTQTILKDTTKDTLLNLPPMEDMQKLNTMKFMVRTKRLYIVKFCLQLLNNS